MPKVSVVVPVYGVEKYIERCARSLFEQTLDDIEYIFVDDCTKDNSIEILRRVIEEYTNRKSQIIILHHDVNKGQAQARKTGILIAKGEYIIHCDSDDWVDADLYANMYTKAITERLDVVICDCNRTIGTTSEIISGGCETNQSKLINQMFHCKVWWSLCNKLFRRDLYEGVVFPVGAMGEDMCICMQHMTKCERIGYVRSNYNYYTNANSIIQNNSPENIIYKFNEIAGNISIVKDFYNKASLQKQFAKGLRYLEYNAMQVLVPGLFDERVKKIWNTSYKGCFGSVLFDSDAKLKERFRCLLIILGLYPFKRI